MAKSRTLQMEDYLQALADIGFIRDEKGKKYYIDSTESVLRIGKYLVPFRKPEIKKSFYFPEWGDTESMDNARRMCAVAKQEEYFINANLKSLDEEIKQCNDSKCRPYITIVYNDSNVAHYGFETRPQSEALKKLCPRIYLETEHIERLQDALIVARDRFEKRLRVWYKKYGARCIHTDTFWGDR